MIADWKLERLRRDHPAAPAEPRAMPDEDRRRFRSELLASIGLPGGAGDAEIALRLSSECRPMVGNAADAEFDLRGCLDHASLDTRGGLVVWIVDSEDLDSASVFSVGFLVRYFDYLWYPSSDDAFIFGVVSGGCLSVDHGGFLRFMSPWGTPLGRL